MNVSFQGVNDLVVTFQAGEGVSRGDFVKLGANGTVAAASYGDGLVGKVLDVRGGCAAVQVRGYVEAEYAGTLNPGWADLTGQGGKVRAAGSNDTSRKCLVLSTDATAKIACLLLW